MENDDVSLRRIRRRRHRRSRKYEGYTTTSYESNAIPRGVFPIYSVGMA